MSTLILITNQPNKQINKCTRKGEMETGNRGMERTKSYEILGGAVEASGDQELSSYFSSYNSSPCF